MIGWYLLGRRRGRKQAEADLDAQAERQRLRAPEPGPPDEVLVEEPSEIPISRASLYDYRKLRGWILLMVMPLVLLGWLVNPWIYFAGLLPFFFSVGFIVEYWENL